VMVVTESPGPHRDVGPHPLRFDDLAETLALLGGEAPLPLATWMRLCCAAHSIAWVVLGLGFVVPFGLQLTASMRARFPAWSVLRAGAICHAINDLALATCAFAYLLAQTAETEATTTEATTTLSSDPARRGGGLPPCGDGITTTTTNWLRPTIACHVAPPLAVGAAGCSTVGGVGVVAGMGGAGASELAGTASLFVRMALMVPAHCLVCAYTPARRQRAARWLQGRILLLLDGEPRSEHERADDDHTAHSTAAAAADDGCVVCLAAASTVVLAPCGHKCVCTECAARLQGLLCPLCRAPVQSLVAAIFE